MNLLVSALLLVVAVIHLLPVVGVPSTQCLTQLYGLPFDEPNLAVLMRHRAVLFGLLGLFLVYAAFQPSVQMLAFIGDAV